MPGGVQVLGLLGYDDADGHLLAQATAAVETVTAMVSAYCRGRHLDGDGVPRDGVAEVVLTAAARLMTNPTGIPTTPAGCPSAGRSTASPSSSWPS